LKDSAAGPTGKPGPGPGPGDRLPVTVIASWYPAVDDVAKGRFVADQVAALVASGMVSPEVVSFDPIPLVGGATARARQAQVIHDAVASAIAEEPTLFNAWPFGVDAGAPVARLAIAEGSIPAMGTTAAEGHRVAALLPLADRLLASPERLPALVHAHTGYPDGAAAAAFAERIDRPLIITEHATFLDRILAEPGQRARYAAGAARASRVIAVSDVLARQIRDALPEIAARVVVVPNTVAVDDFSAGGLDDRTPDELLFVGYRTPIKGIDTLLEAFAIVHAARPTARLRLIGRSTSREVEEVWRRQAATLGIADTVAFDGTADRAGVAAALARASVFVHASRYETFGVVAAEALAAGLPVVATDSGGVAEILGPDPERLGALVPVGDAAALGAAVIGTLERRASFDPATLRAAVVDRFGSRAVADRLVALYAEVIEERRATRPSRAPAASNSPPAIAIERSVSPTVIVALDRSAAAERLAPLPDYVRETVRVVTARSPGSVAMDGLLAVAEVSVAPVRPPVQARWRTGRRLPDRVLRIAADPVAAVRRKTEGDALSPAAVAAAARRVGQAVEALAPSGPTDPKVRLLPLDGRDAIVAAAIARERGLTVTMDGLRGLADRWASGRRED
jgi:glycosyltransferase involved in cell wall biosynthesis